MENEGYDEKWTMKQPEPYSCMRAKGGKRGGERVPQKKKEVKGYHERKGRRNIKMGGGDVRHDAIQGKGKNRQTTLVGKESKKPQWDGKSTAL